MMNRNTKIIAVVAAIMLIVGSAMSASAYFISGGNVGITMGPGGIRIPTQGDNKTIEDKISFPVPQSMDINTDLGSLEFIPVNGSNEVRVEYNYHSSRPKPICKMDGNTLVFYEKNDKSFSFLSFNPGVFSQKDFYVKVYFPAGHLFDEVTGESGLGDLTISDLKARGNIHLDADLGKVKATSLESSGLIVDADLGDVHLTDITTKQLTCDADLGKMDLDHVTATSTKLEDDLGDIILNNCNLGKTTIKADLGAVRADQLISSDLELKANNGGVSITGDLTGKTDINADLGSVELTLAGPRDQYALDVQVDLGSIHVDGQKFKEEYQDNHYAANTIYADCDNGSFTVDFQAGNMAPSK